ncbi:efflux transporter outer membrane subunit [Cyclobacterium sp.]|uniref:TolC family protein n=1 Tax=Cyclobacterium sp. TaxID=1966343 RepID=UPI00198EA74D|nr:efflux transporter outer membrane subunit [Cyclobacterium sp.]MBD3626840.1 efflux transporter outer membrane subunit [Cyclobacterium sp.]
MFLRNQYYLRLIAATCALSLVYACKSIEVPQLPEMEPLPETFLDITDSSSIGDISWEEFFNDPHLVYLIEEGLENNLDLLTALERIEIARTQFRISKGAIYPTMDGIVRYRSGDIRPNLLGGTINGDRNVVNRLENNFIGFQSTWEIDVWGKLRDRKEANFEAFLATEKGRHLLVTNIVAEIAKLYYELLGMDIELETIERNIEFQEMALELIKIQKMAGRATELAVQQFSAQLLSTKSLAFEKRQEIIETENYLNFMLGRFPQPITRASSLLEIKLPYGMEVGIPSDMLLRRPDIQQAEHELRAANYNVEAARKEFFPSFSFTPYVGLNDRSLPAALKMPGGLTIGLLGGLTAPIFAQNRIQAGFDQAIASNNMALYNYQQRILDGYREVMNKLQRIDNLRNVYSLRDEETAVLLNAVSTSNELFRGGYATYLEVITAQSRVLEAELNKTNTRIQMFLTVVDLYRALGGGWN